MLLFSQNIAGTFILNDKIDMHENKNAPTEMILTHCISLLAIAWPPDTFDFLLRSPGASSKQALPAK